ncbi:MAG: hypothetical protein WC910_09570, partial [Bacteroidales bacterium]
GCRVNQEIKLTGGYNYGLKTFYRAPQSASWISHRPYHEWDIHYGHDRMDGIGGYAFFGNRRSVGQPHEGNVFR